MVEGGAAANGRTQAREADADVQTREALCGPADCASAAPRRSSADPVDQPTRKRQALLAPRRAADDRLVAAEAVRDDGGRVLPEVELEADAAAAASHGGSRGVLPLAAPDPSTAATAAARDVARDEDRGYGPLQLGGAAGAEAYEDEEYYEYDSAYASLGLNGEITSDESEECEPLPPGSPEPRAVPDDRPSIVEARRLDSSNGGGGRDALVRLLLNRMQRVIITSEGEERVSRLMAIHLMLQDALKSPPKKRRRKRRRA